MAPYTHDEKEICAKFKNPGGFSAGVYQIEQWDKAKDAQPQPGKPSLSKKPTGNFSELLAMPGATRKTP